MSRPTKILYFNSEEEKSLVDQLSSDYAANSGKTVSSVLSEAILYKPLLPDSYRGACMVEEMYLKHNAIVREPMYELCAYVARNVDFTCYNTFLPRLLKYFKSFNTGFTEYAIWPSSLEKFSTLYAQLMLTLHSFLSSPCIDLDFGPDRNSKEAEERRAAKKLEDEKNDAVILCDINIIKSNLEKLHKDNTLPDINEIIDVLINYSYLLRDDPETYWLLSWMARFSTWKSSPKSRVAAIKLIEAIVRDDSPL